MSEKKLNFEETLSKLDSIISEMGNPDITLSDSVTKYKEALTLISQSKETIENLKKEVESLGSYDSN
ncbi:MAG: exodeoxyribonuclease VII small subunit [Ruminococcus sp.]|jgi:exodeoxyribonuclease VII small subunit|nr:exodeoxyribonuclease VII small subunit [Ruminococcus sp.]